ncbi:MAG: stage IV sporulation protein A [Ruminococcaceae bacterium]|nr:stage IV sporulation protein A [Oscillospiraceae bacterium]
MSATVDIYEDIAKRTQGDIYIGVVGPVRTGKSTFIKRFMEKLVLPGIDNSEIRTRANDELPQSASGKTVMTTEPKFIPEEACEIMLKGKTRCRVKLIDCVGYLVPGATGHEENDSPRMVSTPWSEEAMPFEKAAEIGTRKVIAEHSTIAVAVTTDGTVCDIPRESYIEAEKRVINELKEKNKPFVLVLNSASPEKEETRLLADTLSEEYGCPVCPMNCFDMNENEIKDVLEAILTQFSPKEISVALPGWLLKAGEDNKLRKGIYEAFSSAAERIVKNGDIEREMNEVKNSLSEAIEELTVINSDAGSGITEYRAVIAEELFYKTLGESCGMDIKDDEELFTVMKELSDAKSAYDKIETALREVERTGYGIVTPSIEDMKLEKPEIIKHSGGYGIKLRALAPSVHMIRANIETEVSPIVGSEKQSEDMVNFLVKEYEERPDKIWDTNIFGKTLQELVGEGLNVKLSHVSAEARTKLCDTMSRIINEGSGGLICIIL